MASGHNNPMNLSNLVAGMAPPQPLSVASVVTSIAVSTNPDPPQAPPPTRIDSAAVSSKTPEQIDFDGQEKIQAEERIATSNTDVPMIDAGNRKRTPTQHVTALDEASDGLSHPQPSSNSSQTWDLQQYINWLDGESQQTENVRVSFGSVVQMLRFASRFYQKLGDKEKAHVRYGAEEELDQMGFVPKPEPRRQPDTSGSSERDNFTRAMTPASELPETSTQEDSNLSEQSEMSLEDFCIWYDFDNEHPVANFYWELTHGDVSNRVREYASKQSKGTRPALALDYSTGVPLNNQETVRTLIQKLSEYRDGEPHFCEIWEYIVLADLVHIDYKTFCKEKKFKKEENRFERYVHWEWKPEGVQKMDSVVYRMVAEKIYEGWCWREWCRTLSKETGTLRHGASLLLQALTSPIKHTTLELAKEYVPQAVPWLQEAAKMLDPLAIELYQRQLTTKELNKLERELLKIIGR